jgi:hypothetical protein
MMRPLDVLPLGNVKYIYYLLNKKEIKETKATNC